MSQVLTPTVDPIDPPALERGEVVNLGPNRGVCHQFIHWNFLLLADPMEVWIVGRGPGALTFPTRKQAVNFVVRCIPTKPYLGIVPWSLITASWPIRRIEIPPRPIRIMERPRCPGKTLRGDA